MKPESDCETVNLAENAFYAWPDKACTVVFDPKDWLPDGQVFADLHGGGSFSSQRSAGSITVTIKEKKGFVLHEIIVENESCEERR